MIQIDYEYLKKAKDVNLPPDDAIFLYLIYNKESKLATEWIGESFLKQKIISLEAKGLVKITGENFLEDLEFKPIFTNLVTPINSKINFDEFWDVFPSSTKSGRPLRAVNKLSRDGKPTRDYEVCKKKYLSKVKNEELHKEIVAIMKKRVEVNEIEYLNNMETYINQCKWERDISILKKKGITSIHKML